MGSSTPGPNVLAALETAEKDRVRSFAAKRAAERREWSDLALLLTEKKIKYSNKTTVAQMRTLAAGLKKKPAAPAAPAAPTPPAAPKVEDEIGEENKPADEVPAAEAGSDADADVRAEAKSLGITGWHNTGVEKLKEKIAAHKAQ
jgi:hypothetical protein